MNHKDGLRPVEINYRGDTKKGFFHRFVYMMYGGQSETKVLIELDNGKLRYFDPYFVQFMDRSNTTNSNKNDDPKEEVISSKE
ncbi:hypothetical protein [Marinoscillum sp.]|uniref:hypothetical protein n=1 Tax=Marinoscillum sp. TaxID=2024838 RepID=UPI003BAB1F97